MKKLLSGIVLAALAVLAHPATAQDAPVSAVMPSQKPAATQPVYTAMYFNKLVRRPPDFTTWARATTEYQNALPGDRFRIEEQKSRELQSIYDLLTMQELLTVEVPVVLSSYDATRKGFFVTNFKEDTFFPIRYAGEAYGIVPQGIMDKQWMKVSDDAAAARIMAAIAAKGDKPLTMLVAMTPKYAEGTTPMNIDGENYWLISTEVNQLSLYAPDSTIPLWQSDLESVDKQKRQEILNLRQ